ASKQIPLLRPPFFTAPTMECPCWRLWGLKGATICSLATVDWLASLFFSWRTLGWLSLIGGLAAKLSHAAFRICEPTVHRLVRKVFLPPPHHRPVACTKSWTLRARKRVHEFVRRG